MGYRYRFEGRLGRRGSTAARSENVGEMWIRHHQTWGRRGEADAEGGVVAASGLGWAGESGLATVEVGEEGGQVRTYREWAVAVVGTGLGVCRRGASRRSGRGAALGLELPWRVWLPEKEVRREECRPASGKGVRTGEAVDLPWLVL
ncbi:hypothetical protein MLD38_023699 [Melastoma candidum]|uniref:Uncharacterized protein n=1 Tax=Melastoma candidum TaxID=119954 RepID=A0ACB9NUY6_9MYRT|nr:hypothetical protein MLD38_023699 [Melastoma candidum]